MIANFGEEPITLLNIQRVATANPNHLSIFKSNVTYAQCFGIEENENQMYKRRSLSARDTTLTNKYLADSRTIHMNEKEKPETGDNMY